MEPFRPDQVDAAIDFVIEAAEDRGQTVAYTRVFDAAGLPTPQDIYLTGDEGTVGRFMEAFHYRCRERQLPPLDALVVHVAGSRRGLPGPGYFRVNKFPDPVSDRTKPDDVVKGHAAWEAEQGLCRRWGETHRRERYGRTEEPTGP